MMKSVDPRFLLTSTLLQAGRQWRRLAQEVLAEHEISEARGAALLWVRRLGGGVRQVTLAAYVGIEGTSIVRLLDQLSALGLLERRSDPDDRRANTVWLTEAGERLAEHIEAALGELRERVLKDVGDADLDATLRVFAAIDRAAGDSRAQLALPPLDPPV
ncbi:MarR family winged helix-turn-helix transcriptional regulator [Chelatococcus reniformis]|uniref:MarR family transcriptional regulator n=1 Tax=Chelatococcus reniformis TaxID=1494448 RepID=A0A916XE88_9HYPH|nr:MarR family transcriptional regulator [Chelatococcus reniformis]GGC65266.1 MarR family transcriptional regulator [Chelatococcus reniformis]